MIKVKRILTVLTLFLILTFLPSADTFAAIPGFAPPKRPIKIFIEGREVKLTLPILNKNDRNYYPFRELCEAAGAYVTWDSVNDRAIAELDGNRVEFNIGRSDYYVNGVYKVMPDATTVVDTSVNRSYVPIRYFMEGLGFDVAFFITQRYDIIRVAKNPTEEQDVILQLQGYRDNINTPKYFPDSYLTNEQFINKGYTYGINYTLETAQLISATAKNLLLTHFNVDYKNLNGFYEKYRYFFMPEAASEIWINGKKYTNEEYIQLRINDIKTYQISCESKVITDWSLVYQSWGTGIHTRCRLFIKFNSIKPEYFKKYNMKQLQTNKWYYVDIEVPLAIIPSRNPDKWKHAEFTFDSEFIYISEFKELT